MKTINYDNKLKKIAFHDLEFTDVSTEKVKEVFYDKQLPPQPDDTGFKKMLLEVLSEEIGTEIIKYSILFTPNQPKYDHIGFLYLANRTIMPVKIQPGQNYLAWHKVLTKGSTFFGDKIMDWLVGYEHKASSHGSKGMSYEREGKFYGVENQELYQSTGKYLYNDAPKKFNLKKIASEKRTYLKKYISLHSIASEKEIDLERYTKALKQLNSELASPLPSLQAFKQEFETITGFTLPLELECIFGICDGSSVITQNYSLLSSQQMLEELKTWRQIFDEWTLEELKVHISDQNKTIPMYTTPYWIPFLSDNNGNYIAMDFAPGKKGKEGQVIVFGGDEEIIKVLSESLIDFLESLQNTSNPITSHIK